eukprot:827827-Pleurochrysis_carterae.AAC.1
MRITLSGATRIARSERRSAARAAQLDRDAGDRSHRAAPEHGVAVKRAAARAPCVSSAARERRGRAAALLGALKSARACSAPQ